MKHKPIKIIDLFAGPGGLGEGFSSLQNNGHHHFRISVSVEMEFSAWKTLRLRSFIRQFIHQGKQIPEEYYDYLAGKLGDTPDDILFKIYPEQAKAAEEEALQLKLGKKEDNNAAYKKIKESLNGEKNWVLIGGPPCQAYSLVGRARNKGNKDYVAEEDNRHTLYLEYLKIIEKFSPAIFVMENVKGILSSKLNGELVFSKMLKDLKAPGKALNKNNKQTYRIYSLVLKSESLDGIEPVFDPHEYIIKSEDYGIPQARHRVILLGVREDISKAPDILKPSEKVTVGQAIGDLPRLRSGLSKNKERDTPEGWAAVIKKEISRFKSKKKNDLSLIKTIRNTLEKIDKNNLSKGKLQTQKAKNLYQNMPKELANWYSKNWNRGICNHEVKGHMDSDLARYLFCSVFTQVNQDKDKKIRRTPKLQDFPDVLLPNHKNVKSGKFVDRFKVQEKELPATTITCHISKDGHYYIHYDPVQCRALTVREAARIQTFPDNYFFEGTRTEQYVQVGNAVPPLLANQIARIVIDILT